MALGVPVSPQARVSDYAHALSSEEALRVEAQLASYEVGKTRQIAVALFSSLEGETLEDFTMRLAERWKIGGKHDNDGVLVVLFMREHKARIEVGYGLEGKLPDVRAARVIRDVLAPQLKQGRTADALLLATAAIHDAIADQPLESSKPKSAPEPQVDALPWRKRAPNDATDPRIYDFSGELQARAQLRLEKVAHDLEEGTPQRYLVVIFPQKSAGSDAVLAELDRRWRLKKGRVVIFCSYLDSVMEEHVSPALRQKLSDEVLAKIVAEHIRPFYADDNMSAGLEAGLMAADVAVTGREHEIEKFAPQIEVTPEVEAVAATPERPQRWYLLRAFDDDTARRLVSAPPWVRIPVLLLLLPFAVLAYLPFMFSIFGLLVFIVMIVNPWALAWRARSPGVSFVASVSLRLAAMWGPILAAAIWTRQSLWMAFAGVVTLLLAWGAFAKRMPRRKNRAGAADVGTAFTASSNSWSSSSASSTDIFGGDGGSFGGGGASGDW